MEEIDDELEEKDIELVRCSERNIEKEYGFGFSPILVRFFKILSTFIGLGLEILGLKSLTDPLLSKAHF